MKGSVAEISGRCAAMSSAVGFAPRRGEPAVAEPDEDPGVATRAGRVAPMSELAGAAGKEDDQGDHELGVEGAAGTRDSTATSLPADRLGDHPRMAEGKNAVREDPVRRTFDRDDVHEPDDAGLRSRIVGSSGCPKSPADDAMNTKRP